MSDIKDGYWYVSRFKGDDQQTIVQVKNGLVYEIGWFQALSVDAFHFLSPVPPYIEPGEGEITLVNQKAQ